MFVRVGVGLCAPNLPVELDADASFVPVVHESSSQTLDANQARGANRQTIANENAPCPFSPSSRARAMAIVVDIVFLAGGMASNAGGRARTVMALMASGDEGRKGRK